jgi:O-antigen/teichoic acid export membrane protein
MLIMGWVDTIMIGIFRDEKSVGIYNVSLKIASIIGIVLVAINSIAAPKFAELYSKNKIKVLQKVITQSSKLIFFVSFPLLLINIVFSVQILSLFGKDFIVAKWALITLCCGQFVNIVSGSVGYILQMTGNEIAFQNIILLSIFVNILLNYYLIPQYGINGAAVASAISMSMWNLLSIIYCKKLIGIKSYYVPFGI